MLKPVFEPSTLRSTHTGSSTVASGQGEGIRLADVGAPGGHKFFSFRDFQDGSATGYRGLRNQGATCYLNSLLQAMYMTPDFKHALQHLARRAKLERLALELALAHSQLRRSHELRRSQLLAGSRR